jgi:hypothetical protein
MLLRSHPLASIAAHRTRSLASHRHSSCAAGTLAGGQRAAPSAGARALRARAPSGRFAVALADWTVEYQLLHAQHSWSNIPQEEDPPADAPVAPADLDNHTSVLYVLEHLAEYYNWP